jgi:hypothetical protein
MRFRLVSSVAVGALLLALAGIAIAAKPKAGYTYSNGSSSPSVFFKAGSAKKLVEFSAGLAIKCNSNSCGGFGGVEGFTSNSVKVASNGTFKVSGGIFGAAPGGKHGKKLGTETVTGKFVSSTEVKGKVTTHISLGSGPHGYHGVTKSYTAIGRLVG